MQSKPDQLQSLDASELKAQIEKTAQQETKLAQKSASLKADQVSYDQPLEDYINTYLRRHYQAAGDYLDLQEKYAFRLFVLVCVWLFAVLTAVFFSGFQPKLFIISDSVMIAFITSSTASVLGLFLLVAKWLFIKGERSRVNLHQND